MRIKTLDKCAYTKVPLNEIYSEISEVPDEFLMDWLKDKYDYQRLHSDEELKRFLEFTPEQILNWLEEATVFVREAHKND